MRFALDDEGHPILVPLLVHHLQNSSFQNAKINKLTRPMLKGFKLGITIIGAKSFFLWFLGVILNLLKLRKA